MRGFRILAPVLRPRREARKRHVHPDHHIRGSRRYDAGSARAALRPYEMPKATILIVDDEPGAREVLEEYFVAPRYAAIVAEQRGAARALAEQHPFDLALVDIGMPGEDG